MVEGVGLHEAVRTRHPPPLGRVVGHREPQRFHNLHVRRSVIFCRCLPLPGTSEALFLSLAIPDRSEAQRQSSSEVCSKPPLTREFCGHTSDFTRWKKKEKKSASKRKRKVELKLKHSDTKKTSCVFFVPNPPPPPVLPTNHLLSLSKYVWSPMCRPLHIHSVFRPQVILLLLINVSPQNVASFLPFSCCNFPDSPPILPSFVLLWVFFFIFLFAGGARVVFARVHFKTNLGTGRSTPWRISSRGTTTWTGRRRDPSAWTPPP